MLLRRNFGQVPLQFLKKRRQGFTVSGGAEEKPPENMMVPSFLQLKNRRREFEMDNWTVPLARYPVSVSRIML